MQSILTPLARRGFDCTMSELPIDLASVDWLSVAQLYAFVFLSTLIGTLALMFAAVLFFWSYYPDDSAAPVQQ
jgi:hypothetical protein